MNVKTSYVLDSKESSENEHSNQDDGRDSTEETHSGTDSESESVNKTMEKQSELAESEGGMCGKINKYKGIAGWTCNDFCTFRWHRSNSAFFWQVYMVCAVFFSPCVTLLFGLFVSLSFHK